MSRAPSTLTLAELSRELDAPPEAIRRVGLKRKAARRRTGRLGKCSSLMAGVGLVHVPYRGGAAVVTDLLGGQVHVLFGSTSLTIEQIRAGKVRPLAVTTATPWEGLPDIPTVGNFVPGYEASTVFGLGAPKRTPAAIIDKLNEEINAGLADPKIKARLADLGGTPLVGSPAAFGKLIADETEKWGKMIKFAGIKPQ